MSAQEIKTNLKPMSGMKMLIVYLAVIAFGVLAGLYGGSVVHQGTEFLATIFIRIFKFISVPIIAVSIIATLARVSQSSQSGRIFRQTVLYTLATTLAAAALAAVLFVIYAPENVASNVQAAPINLSEHSYLEYARNIVPDNLLAPFLSSNVLSVLLIAVAVGLAIDRMPRESETHRVMLAFFTGSQEILFTLVRWVIVVLPLGVFAFVTNMVVEMQAGVAVGGIGTYFAAVVSANLIQMFVILPLLLLIKGFNPFKVMVNMAPALMLAFFSKSSAGTLPVTMQCAEDKQKVKSSVSRFVLPICTTINMNGCAAFILLTVVYLMQNAGIEITPMMLLTWVGIATIAAVGNAGVPMGCFFLSVSLLTSMNVPIYLMGVILPVYAVVDMIETSLNVWSDSVVCTIVDKDLR